MMLGEDQTHIYEEQAVAYLVGRFQRNEDTLSCLASLQTKAAAICLLSCSFMATWQCYRLG